MCHVGSTLVQIVLINIKENGFKINSHNTCVANKTINGKQCTIVWYMDDIKVLHIDKLVVIKVMDVIADKSGG